MSTSCLAQCGMTAVQCRYGCLPVAGRMHGCESARLLNPQVAQQKQEKPAVPVDPNVREAQRSLESSLGVKVEIHDRKGKGKIILKYGSLEDFDRIVEALAAK